MGGDPILLTNIYCSNYIYLFFITNLDKFLTKPCKRVLQDEVNKLTNYLLAKV